MIPLLQRNENNLFSKTTLVYLRDVQDHAIHIVEAVETLREMGNSLVDTYYFTLSQRMNEVMKVLTIIATIFIPLSFIAGVYGMNFEIMPELKWPHGYPVILGVMFLVALVMLSFFRRKHWI